jgi:predicted ATPase/class 3 adenylate cyclase/DNA-binding CsgD family transcriptional regulator
MSDRVGQRLGNYHLLRLIGRGSFAEVYLGEHLHLGTQAAIKVLNANLSGEGSEQLLSEARTMSRLAHPHIVRVLDFGIEDGVPFLVMDYAPGGSLRQRHPKVARVPLELVVSYVGQVAEALHYMHLQKLIHRDVKPENMLLDAQNGVLLTEFDLTIISQSSRSQQTQEAVGSVTYMAPEQLKGKARSASDQYALGVVAYEWLCGDPPFSGSVQQVAMQHLSTPPPPLRAKAPAIPQEIEEVVLKALAKEPERRFPNVQSFALALEEAFYRATAAPPRIASISEQSMTRTRDQQGQRSSSDLPTGTVTMLFTDIEGSTRLLERLGDRYVGVLAQCRRVMRNIFQEWNGHEVDTQGDAFFVVFARASDAVQAAANVQRALATHPWPEGERVRVRMSISTGEPTRTAEGYVGMDVHRAARIMSAAHGGQVLLSQATATLVEQDLPDDISLRDLGEFRLKDLGRPRRLFQLVISGLPADFPRLRTLDTYQHNLPVQLTPFIGREQELNAVQDLLSREDVRLLTLTGPGGTGKTRLGLQVAAELSDHFTDGVFFVNLAPINDSTLVMSTIAQALDIREATGQAWPERMREVLQQKKMLLLLDNFEQVVSAGVEVVDMLAACPQLKVVVTSREVLHVRGEREFAVPSMSLPDLKNLPDLATLSFNAAVALFLQRAQAIKPDFQLTNANARAIVEICARLDGLPLAIELAAARVKLLPPQALLSRLDQRLSILTGASRDAPARQQTLRNAIAWSYNLLNEAEQKLFRRLSVFVGGFTLEAAEAVCDAPENVERAGEALELLSSLIDKSLLRQAEQEGEELRFIMLETIREYGIERLVAHAETGVAQQAHAEYYLALAERAESELAGSHQVVWLERLEQEHDNLRAALQWLLEQGEAGQSTVNGWEMALRLGAALEQFWLVRGHYTEGRTFLERALAGHEGATKAVQAKALGTAARLALNQGDTDRAEVLCKESLSLWQELGDTTGIALSLQRLAIVAWIRNNAVAARSLTEEALARWKEVGDVPHLAEAHAWLAYMAGQQGEYTRALALYEESLSHYRELESKIDTIDLLGELTELLYLSQSDSARVRSLLDEVLALVREVGDKMGIAHGQRFEAQLALSQGDTTTARSRIEEALSLFKEIGNREGMALSHALLARIEAGQGNHAAARAFYEESLTLASKGMNDKGAIASSLEGLASVVAAQGEQIWAARLWGAAEAFREAIGTPLRPIERAGYERSVAAARASLGEKAFATALAEGRAMTPEQALVAQGPVTLTPSISREPSPAPSAKPSPTYPDGLTAREVEVLRLLAQGMTDAHIAEQLVISPRTVNNHLTSIYSKIQVSSRSAATRYAVDHQLI